jgi:hypothetical protein
MNKKIISKIIYIQMLSHNNNNNHITKKRIYNFCLNSNFGGKTPATGSTFFIDWSVMPEGEYKVSFTFTSTMPLTDLGNSTNAVIYLDLGQASTSIIESSVANSVNAYRGGFLGCLRQSSFAVGATTVTDYITFLYADTTTNPPVYIFTRPRNSQVSVDIHTSSTSTTTNFSPIGDYVLTLSFELQ